MVAGVGCAAPTTWLPLDAKAIGALKAKTIALVIHEPPTFQLYGSGAPRGSATGDVSALIEGSRQEKLIADLTAHDPSARMGDRIVAALANKYGLSVGTILLLPPGRDVSDGPSGPDLVVKSRTLAWRVNRFDGAISYGVWYSARIELLVRRGHRELAVGQCHVPPSRADLMAGTSYGEMLANNGARVKKALREAEAICTAFYEERVFTGLPRSPTGTAEPPLTADRERTWSRTRAVCEPKVRRDNGVYREPLLSPPRRRRRDRRPVRGARGLRYWCTSAAVMARGWSAWTRVHHHHA